MIINGYVRTIASSPEICIPGRRTWPMLFPWSRLCDLAFAPPNCVGAERRFGGACSALVWSQVPEQDGCNHNRRLPDSDTPEQYPPCGG